MPSGNEGENSAPLGKKEGPYPSHTPQYVFAVQGSEKTSERCCNCGMSSFALGSGMRIYPIEINTPSLPVLSVVEENFLHIKPNTLGTP